VLTAANTLADEDGMGAVTYQWQRDNVNIAGATGPTYRLVGDDNGKDIRVVASYTDSHSNQHSVTSATQSITAPTVTISGTAQEDEVLTAATPDFEGTITYEWYRDGVNTGSIQGPNNTNTYTLTQAEVGHVIFVKAVSHHDNTYDVQSTSTATVANVNDNPSGTVTFTGTSEVSNVLTAANTLADEDGMGAVTYQWQSSVANANDFSNITNATANTYTLLSSDANKDIRVNALYTDTPLNNAGTATVVSSASLSVTNPTITITGTVTEDQQLSVDLGTLQGTVTYQWQHKESGNFVDVVGATSATYTLDQTNVGKEMKVLVNTDVTGVNQLASGATIQVVNVNDSPTGAVTISGTSEVSNVLTAANTLADEDGPSPLVVTYQWQRDNVNIAGATNGTYVLVSADANKDITVVASYTDSHSNQHSVTSDTQSITAPTISISGTAQEDVELTASHGNMLGTIAYQWIAGEVDIAGATNQTFTPTQNEVGKTIKVRVTATNVPNANGEIIPYTSPATGQTINVNDSPTGAVTIDGTFEQGQTLTANTTNIADEDGLGAFSYQWKHSAANGQMTNISGATNSTYVLQSTDVGRKINVTVTYTDTPLNNTGTGESLTSVSTGATRVKQQVGSVTTSGGSANAAGTAEIANKWNTHNTSLNIVVPVVDDNSLVGGTIQPRIKVGNNAFENVGTAHTIVSGDKDAGSVSINVLEAAIEGATNYADTAVLSFNVVIVDADNFSTGDNLTSATTLTVDVTVPTVSSFVLSETSLRTGGAATVTLTFAEAVTNFSSADDITYDTNVGTLGTMSSTDGGQTWTGTFTPFSNIQDTTNILTLSTNYTDVAGNTGVGNTTANFEIDTGSGTQYPQNIDIPLIFDMSGNATVFGEDVVEDIVTNHMKLKYTASTSQSTNFINAFKNIYYTDSSVAGEANGVLFYKNFADSSDGGLGTIIQHLLFHSTAHQHAGTTKEENYGKDANNNYGIPIGSTQTSTSNHDGTASNQSTNYYSGSMIDNVGATFSKILIRVACAHLMGHPFSQAFIQENTVQADLLACDINGQVRSSFQFDDNGTSTGTTLKQVSTAVGAEHLKSDGRTNNVLQTIYEQLLRVNLAEHSLSDTSGNPPSSASSENYGILRELTFKAGNVITLYIRPRLFFKIDLLAGSGAGPNPSIQNALGNSVATNDGTGNPTATNNTMSTTQKIFNSIFSTNTGENAKFHKENSPEGFKWLAGRGTADAGDAALNQWQTNLKISDVQSELDDPTPGNRQAMLDGHIWKLDITLT